MQLLQSYQMLDRGTCIREVKYNSIFLQNRICVSIRTASMRLAMVPGGSFYCIRAYGHGKIHHNKIVNIFILSKTNKCSIMVKGPNLNSTYAARREKLDTAHTTCGL